MQQHINQRVRDYRGLYDWSGFCHPLAFFDPGTTFFEHRRKHSERNYTQTAPPAWKEPLDWTLEGKSGVLIIDPIVPDRQLPCSLRLRPACSTAIINLKQVSKSHTPPVDPPAAAFRIEISCAGIASGSRSLLAVVDSKTILALKPHFLGGCSEEQLLRTVFSDDEVRNNVPLALELAELPMLESQVSADGVVDFRYTSGHPAAERDCWLVVIVDTEAYFEDGYLDGWSQELE